MRVEDEDRRVGQGGRSRVQPLGCISVHEICLEYHSNVPLDLVVPLGGVLTSDL